MADHKILIIIPTYNEAENIERIIPLVLLQDDQIDILVVDDNSPDGTAEIVRKMKEKQKRIHLIKRTSKQGLGTAYVAGFHYALERDYSLVFEMDADLSHDPEEIPNFLKASEEYDLVIGSRYIKGVNVVNWPLSRLLLSYTANLYTRVVTGLPLCDATSGFKCFRRQVLEAIDLDKVRSDGYSFQIEMDFLAWKKGFKLQEIPIVFVDRNIGDSKMNSHIIHEAVWMVWKLRFQSLLNKI